MVEEEGRGEPLPGTYTVTLPNFEGPLDLLLHLCQKHELSILEIPIAFITEKYLEYLAVMQLMNLDVAAEYLVMAATLAHIKSKMLLPAPPPGQEDDPADEEGDPREALIKRLLEYQKYKHAAEQLVARGITGQDTFYRGAPAEEAIDTGLPPLAPVPLYSLIEAFQKVLSKSKVKLTHDIVADRLTLSDRIQELTDFLRHRRRLTFEELFDGLATRFDLVITFLALLEMTRQKLVRLYQTEPLAPLYLEPSILDANGAPGEGEEPSPSEPPAGGVMPVAESVADVGATDARDAFTGDEALGEERPAEGDPFADPFAELATESGPDLESTSLEGLRVSGDFPAPDAGTTAFGSGGFGVDELRAGELLPDEAAATDFSAADFGAVEPGVASEVTIAVAASVTSGTLPSAEAVLDAADPLAAFDSGAAPAADASGELSSVELATATLAAELGSGELVAAVREGPRSSGTEEAAGSWTDLESFDPDEGPPPSGETLRSSMVLEAAPAASDPDLVSSSMVLEAAAELDEDHLDADASTEADTAFLDAPFPDEPRGDRVSRIVEAGFGRATPPPASEEIAVAVPISSGSAVSGAAGTKDQAGTPEEDDDARKEDENVRASVDADAPVGPREPGGTGLAKDPAEVEAGTADHPEETA